LAYTRDGVWHVCMGACTAAPHIDCGCIPVKSALSTSHRRSLPAYTRVTNFC